MSKRNVQPSAEVTILVLRDLYKYIQDEEVGDDLQVYFEEGDAYVERTDKFDALLARAETVLLAYGMIRRED